jgi:4-amino-4-deoxy-L-arabinose transferase-like glycosyltransferase
LESFDAAAQATGTERTSRRDARRVFAIALLARVAVVLWAAARFPAVEDGHYYDTLARRLATGAGYTWAWPDGAVTYAAHYPVGYPALLALVYVVFGASTGAAMSVNALLGAASAYAAHRLVALGGAGRWAAISAGTAVALHPALLPYTAAVMTEGVTASLWIIAAAAAASVMAEPGRGKAWARLVGSGVAMGMATLVRPQSLVLAPVFGAMAAKPEASTRTRTARAAASLAIAVLCVLPWTARNCERMHRCALVSVNEGWNLLIGAQTTTGSWEPVSVPRECATVWDEAGKDSCFDRVARREIAEAPGAWLARAPAKLAATFDYVGAAPWYLHASDPNAFGDRAKLGLAVVETVADRLLLLAALVACGLLEGPRPIARKCVALLGAATALTLHAWMGYVFLTGCIALLGPARLARNPAAASTMAVIAATAAMHAVFFGAGRYGLMVLPFVTALAFTVPFPLRRFAASTGRPAPSLPRGRASSPRPVSRRTPSNSLLCTPRPPLRGALSRG